MVKNINELIEKYRVLLILITVLSVIISYAPFLIKGGALKDYFLAVLVSMMFYLFGYYGGLAVLGLQAQNSLCPLKIFNFFCQITILFFSIGWLITVIMIPCESLMGSNLEVAEFFPNISPGPLGFMLSANKLRKMYVIEQKPRKMLFSKKTF